MTRRHLGILFACFLLFAGGCATKKPVIAPPEQRPKVAPEVLEAWYQKGLDAFQFRYEQGKLSEAIMYWEKVVEADPMHRPALEHLSHAIYALTYSFLDKVDSDKQLELYYRSRMYGEQALRARPELNQVFEKNGSWEKRAAAVEMQDIDGLFWMAAAWARWGELKGVLKVVMDIPKIKDAYQRVLDLDETYFGAGAHRFFGAYFVKIPAFAGRSLEKSKEHFDKAVELAPYFLENKLLYAQYYAAAMQDQNLFTKLLQEVLTAEISQEDEFYLENLTSQERAREMLNNMKEYF